VGWCGVVRCVRHPSLLCCWTKPLPMLAFLRLSQAKYRSEPPCALGPTVARSPCLWGDAAGDGPVLRGLLSAGAAALGRVDETSVTACQTFADGAHLCLPHPALSPALRVAAAAPEGTGMASRAPSSQVAAKVIHLHAARNLCVHADTEAPARGSLLALPLASCGDCAGCLATSPDRRDLLAAAAAVASRERLLR
jgi:hypothetical protein